MSKSKLFIVICGCFAIPFLYGDKMTIQMTIAIGAIFIVVFVFYLVFRSPFHYPYFEYSFDVSGKRKPDVVDLIDDFLNHKRFLMIDMHEKKVEHWKTESQKRIEKSVLKKYREKQYKKALDDEKAYIFYITRGQTRYVQRNYVRTPYKVLKTINQFVCDYQYLANRNEQLKNINYECTIKEYNNKNQRKLMTKDLRQKIIKRDRYTCQICGKYMPDEVGLHVDHIIPVSKGGKTVLSNLQVLCSKCNGSKSNK